MRVALTGVSGFIGAAIARHLHGAGHTITGLVRSGSRRDHVEAFVDRFVVGEQADRSAWPALLDGAECVIHNSVNRYSLEVADDLEEHWQSNLVGSVALLEAASPRQFIFISTCAVHHDIRPRWGGVIDEDHPLRPISVYGAYKAAVEAHLWAAHFGRGQNTAAIRPCAVYGVDPTLHRSHGYAMLRQLAAERRFDRPGGGKVVHVDDVAAATVAAVGNPAVAGRPFNLVDDYARHADWAAIGAEVLGIDAAIDRSSPAQPVNTFSKDAARTVLGVALDRGHAGIREHLRELAEEMRRRGELNTTV